MNVGSCLPRKVGIVTRIFPLPSSTGGTGVLSNLVEDKDDRLRKNDKGVFFFFGSTGFSVRTSVQV